jgi:hypothetical protein
MVGRVGEGGRKILFFLPLPQNILVPPTPATGCHFPLLCVREKMIILSFFLDARARRRDAARCGVVPR